jgi:DNA-binding transcriptional regulator YhcF (GntR family)
MSPSTTAYAAGCFTVMLDTPGGHTRRSTDGLYSTRFMAAEYGVARMTVSRAVRELRERGLVRTVIGKGTYVI